MTFSIAVSHNDILERCSNYAGTDALEIALSLMLDGVVRFHGPEHHYLTSASLCAAWCNAAGEDKTEHLARLKARCAAIPPAVCGYYGVCGDTLAAGACASEMLGVDYLSGEGWRLINELAARVQAAIASSCTRGPRCCKRTTFAALTAASLWLRDSLGVPVTVRGAFTCPLCSGNDRCIGPDCTFFPGK